MKFIAYTGIADTFLRDNRYPELIQEQLMVSADNGRFIYFADGKISFALKRELRQADITTYLRFAFICLFSYDFSRF